MTSVGLAGPDDLDAVLALVARLHEHEGLPPAGAAVRAALVRLLGDPRRGAVLVARDGPRVVGHCVVTFGYSLEFHGVDAFIDELLVVDAWRGRGVGTRLLAAAEAHCAAAGVAALHLEAGHGNPRAHALYRRLGFVDHERHLMTRRIAGAGGLGGRDLGPA